MIEDLDKNKIVYRFDYGISLRDQDFSLECLEDLLGCLYDYYEDALPKLPLRRFERNKKTED